MNVHAPELWQRKLSYLTEARAECLKGHVGVASVLLSEDLGFSEMYIRLIQRKLSLRKCLNAPRKAGDHVLR